MERYVNDIELTIPDRRPRDMTIKRVQDKHSVTKPKPVMRANGECTVRTVSKEEMEKLWE